MGPARRYAGRTEIMIILPYSDGDFDGVAALWRETAS